jgi:N6-adenosine-specific RNA methylase IME4
VTLSIDLLRIDGETQPRVQMNWVTVSEYAEVLTAGMALPPVTVFYDGNNYWLADGFHRREAAIKAGHTEIAIERRIGTREDAQWFSYGANSTHGLPRTPKDRKRAVEAALAHPKAASMSSTQIAAHCGVSHQTVLNYKAAILPNLQDTGERTVTRNGTTYTMQTQAIGARQDAPATTPTFDMIDWGTEDTEPAPVFTPPPPLPRTRYDCLVIDPPWEIEKIQREVRPNQVEMDYPPMTIDELQNLPVGELAADNAHLYLWTTHKHLPHALALATSWGFRYQCLLTWVKNVGFTPFSFMYSTEHVLFCRRGSVPLTELGRRLDFTGKVREHSRKPDEFYELVRDVSPGRRLELFARERRPGFDAWGNEVDRFSLELVDA